MAGQYGDFQTKQSLETFLRERGLQFGKDLHTRHSTFVLRRLLDRIFQVEALGLQLKGGMGLRMRTLDARYTTDLDLTSGELSLLEMKDLIQTQASMDLNDSLNFEIQKFAPLQTIATQPSRQGARMSLRYSWGASQSSTTVNLDLVHDENPFPANIPSPGIMEPPADLPRSQIKLFALSHQIAQKVCGCLETHNGQPSSRAKDLIDLVIIAKSFPIGRLELIQALAFEFARRNLAMPVDFSPNATLLKAFAIENKKLGPIALPGSARQAVDLVNDFLELDGTKDLAARWDPASCEWRH